MKKSEMYREAQKAVINAMHIPTDIRLEVVKLLMHDEELAIFKEDMESEQNGEL